MYRKANFKMADRVSIVSLSGDPEYPIYVDWHKDNGRDLYDMSYFFFPFLGLADFMKRHNRTVSVHTLSLYSCCHRVTPTNRYELPHPQNSPPPSNSNS
jgi:hypothetical protein